MKRMMFGKTLSCIACLILAGLGLTGCPPDTGDDAEYQAGFDEGFMEDDWYWAGFYDSYDEVDVAPIYYQGSTIPQVEDPPYDAGYYDGLWYAYNDGYFVDYDYAFTCGFSEGYDAAYASDWIEYLDSDAHVEYKHGGWVDGYNDGFSEGRVFGAVDYDLGLTFDWLNALLDYRSGTDLYLEEVGFGTGAYGPVELYEYGKDPVDLKSSDGLRVARLQPAGRGIRNGGGDGEKVNKFEKPDLSYRAFPDGVPERYGMAPALTPRGDRALGLTTTRITRINAYLEAMQDAKQVEKTASPRQGRVAGE